MNDRSPIDAFIDSLLKLVEEEKRGALAALRRGLGTQPGEAPEMFPYVVPYLSNRPNRDLESAYYLVASLFALHGENAEDGNLGNHMAACIQSDGDRAAVERRFVALLKSHPDDLPDMLRQSVGYIKSKGKPVNYRQLLRDLLAWSAPERYVQRRWAAGFWGQTRSEAQVETKLSQD